MGFLSKKSMLVSLLAVSLAACASKPIKTGPPIDLPCDGDAGVYKIPQKADTITFRTGSACNLTDVNFTTDVGKTHFKNKKHTAATSGAAAASGDPVTFDYDGSQLGDGAYFNYTTLPPGSSTDGSGGGVIRN
jgi:hypothetical protein